jgi:hypothetical protein
MKSRNRDMLLTIGLVAGLSACGVNPVKSTLPLDLSQPGGIGIKMTTDNGNIDTGAIMQQVGKNLSVWSYPIAPMVAAPVSHTMTAVIGNVEHSSTPAGFSFSMGNSDPRALDFQKADVLPITCKLSSVQNEAQSAELNMGFADSAVTGARPDVKALSDHASTVCFNLLQEINWPVKTSSADTKSVNPSWMPEIRIETETEDGASPILPSPAETSAPKSESEQPETKPAESKAVTKEITKEGRKIYIIHNQGNPVIFKFGHERK